MLGAMKFYPASLKYMGKHSKKYSEYMQMDEAGGCVELLDEGQIKYYFPLENRKEFFLTPHPNPEWLDKNKYSKIMLDGQKKSQ